MVRLYSLFFLTDNDTKCVKPNILPQKGADDDTTGEFR